MKLSKAYCIDGEDTAKIIFTKAGVRLDYVAAITVELETEEDGEARTIEEYLSAILYYASVGIGAFIPRRLYIIALPALEMLPIDLQDLESHLRHEAHFNTRPTLVSREKHQAIGMAIQRMEIEPYQIDQLIILEADADKNDNLPIGENNVTHGFHDN